MKGLYLLTVLFLSGIQIHSVRSQLVASVNCVGRNFETFAYPGSNTYYYYCYNNQALLVHCAQNSYYSLTAQTCISSSSYPALQLCQPGQTQTLPDATNCHNYIQCLNGQTYMQSCPADLYYDSDEQGCTSDIPISCAASNPTGTCFQNQILADPNNCQNYIQCINGELYTQSCPSGLYYNPLQQGCSSSIPVSCRADNSIGLCSLQNQVLADPMNCQNFIQCINGQPYTMTCSNGWYYNQITESCGPSIPARCNGQSSVGNICSIYSQNQMVADPTNCQRYYQCSNGQQILNTCPGGYFYHTMTQACGPTVAPSCGNNNYY